MESFHALTKFARPTNRPGLPTLVLESESQRPMTKGYAMKTPSRMTVGARSSPASSRSFSRKRVSGAGWEVPGGGGGPPAPPGAGPPRPPRDRLLQVLSVDLLQLTLGPLDGILGLRAAGGLGVHVHDDVLRVGLGGVGRRGALVAQHEGLARRALEDPQRLVDLRPHRVVFPLARRSHAVAGIDLEPLLVVRVGVVPLEEVFGELLVLRVLHDAVLEGQVERKW